jgi:hypothetical protein
MNQNNRKELLKEWLEEKCAYSSSVYVDPGYTSSYKKEFNIVNGIGCKNIYEPNDIDSELNIEYNEAEYNLDEYIDYILIKGMTETYRQKYFGSEYDELYKIIQRLPKKNMVILPGSNHSNANYLYKRLIKSIDDNNITYMLPYVSADPKASFKNIHKPAKMIVDKEKFYYYLYKNR